MKGFFNTRYLLLAIAVALTTIHFQLIWRTGHQGQFLEASIVCWAAAWFMIWRRRQELNFKSTPIASAIGLACIAWILLRSLTVNEYDSFMRFLPLMSGISVALLASGFTLNCYWRELLTLGLMAIPTTTILSQFDISPLTAEFSGSLLWYAGFRVLQEGVLLHLPTGSVEVYPGCSGLQLIWQHLSLGILFVLVFPIGWMRSLIVSIAAVLIAFVVNSIRVALMAVLVAQNNRDAFDYWHLGTGSLIFSLISVSLFGLLCYVLLEQVDRAEEEEEVQA
ncbi:cyanoexosortase A [Leptolyngbya sp. FACHB-17]|uniref:cyanoexosortase A n=1 Tax=unclassified Leptolyngbya TaxID=2650499 RepID=UPI001681601E|nr:cyanoexosortase A [Leptolyngbya sp. FACHB-17]MBD2081334.1 cyanoexosortase A [Leptolyngbya sp. FACHB-17]